MNSYGLYMLVGRKVYIQWLVTDGDYTCTCTLALFGFFHSIDGGMMSLVLRIPDEDEQNWSLKALCKGGVLSAILRVRSAALRTIFVSTITSRSSSTKRSDTIAVQTSVRAYFPTSFRSSASISHSCNANPNPNKSVQDIARSSSASHRLYTPPQLQAPSTMSL